jgi:tRNA1Val (adenine37-N6)-methyltransferase
MGRNGKAYFQFKQFTIWQEHCGMKVGTDSILLGAWTDGIKAQHILDIGTGTGLIALMLAQRSQAQIDAIEIDRDAYQQALSNIAQSPWSHRITVHHRSIQNYDTAAVYNLIVSNPPFFENTSPSDNLARNTARQSDQLTMVDILQATQRLLQDSGKLAIIYPILQAQQFSQKAEACDLFCHRRLWVMPTPNHSPKRVLMEWGRCRKKLEESTIAIETHRHHYTQEYRQLTQNFLRKAALG